MAPIGEMAPGCGKRSKKEIFNCIFAPPSERWHRVRSQRVNPRVSATAPGPRGDIRAPLLSRTITTDTCVASTLSTRGNESSCFHLIGMKIVRSQNKLTTHIRYTPPTATQITEGACMVLYLVQTRQDKNDSGKLEARKKSHATN